MSPRKQFGILLTKYMDRCEIKHRDFADKVGISHGHPANLRAGKRTPPLDDLEKMATVLELSAEERAEFKEVALLAHAPPEVTALVGSLRRKLAKEEKQNALLLKQHALLLEELRRAGIKPPENVDE